MNYQEFKQYREQVAQRASLLRLDCMNPFKALNFLKKDTEVAQTFHNTDVLDLLAQRMGIEKYRKRLIASQGVRASIKSLFKKCAAENKEMWLPEDIYPFYWEVASEMGIIPKSFTTLPSLDLSSLDKAKKNSVIVLSNPINPLGRTLKAREVLQIKNWLDCSKDRELILDTVYSYTHSFSDSTIELFKTDKCFVAYSLSKAWLEPGVFGILLAPEKFHNKYLGIVDTPQNKACSAAFAVLKKHEDFPAIQQEIFTKEWMRLAPSIQKFAPDFHPPQTGYFAVVSGKYIDILNEHNALAIPATVFGSHNTNISIISCLYGLS